MRTLGILFCIVIAAVVPAGSTTTVAPDGTWWNGLDDTGQVNAVQAAMSGYEAGWVSGAAYGMAYGHIGIATIQKVVAQRMPRFPQSLGFYVDAVTDYYRQHPDKAKFYQVGSVISCLAAQAPPSCGK
jgi:hypothetical protein